MVFVLLDKYMFIFKCLINYTIQTNDLLKFSIFFQYTFWKSLDKSKNISKLICVQAYSVLE